MHRIKGKYKNGLVFNTNSFCAEDSPIKIVVCISANRRCKVDRCYTPISHLNGTVARTAISVDPITIVTLSIEHHPISTDLYACLVPELIAWGTIATVSGIIKKKMLLHAAVGAIDNPCSLLGRNASNN